MGSKAPQPCPPGSNRNHSGFMAEDSKVEKFDCGQILEACQLDPVFWFVSAISLDREAGKIYAEIEKR